MCWLVSRCPHAFKTFERTQLIRETIIITSNKTMSMVWRVLLSQGPHDPNQLENWGHFFKPVGLFMYFV